MNDESNFEAWKRARAGGKVPSGFADRVMARIGEHAGSSRPAGTVLLLTTFTSNRPARIAMTLLAVTVFLYRAVCAFGVFFTG